MSEAHGLGLVFEIPTRSDTVDAAHIIEDISSPSHRELERRPLTGQLKESEETRRKRDAVFTAGVAATSRSSSERGTVNRTAEQCSRVIGKVGLSFMFFSP